MHNKDAKTVLEILNTDASVGLSSIEATKRIEENGYNEFTQSKKTPFIIKFLAQFKDVLIIILLIAAVISLIVEIEEWVDSVVIFFVVIVNAVLGIFQENKAEKSLEALKKLSAPMCKVIRDGNTLTIPSRELVKGDIILIEAGDFVPADSRLIECSNLLVDEASLTGESVSSTKSLELCDGPIGDLHNMLFSSTFVTNGRGKAVVCATGMNTEIGKIAGMLSTEAKNETPLQIKLTQVGKIIGIISIVICAVVFALEYASNQSDLLGSFKHAVALAVAAIPEGLATIVTIVLAIGVSNMSKANAIVKKLPAVETLGCTSIVCSDKTGTLTQNKMTVVEVYLDSIKTLDKITKDELTLINYFALCSDAKINIVDGVEQRVGDPTETALIELNNKYGSEVSSIERVNEIPFDSTRKMMSVVVKINNKIIQITKGAPDIIIKNSITSPKLKTALEVNENMGSRALRVLGIGYKELSSIPSEMSLEDETNLNFLGLVAMIDPSRPEVKQSIALAKAAGIRTIMITGDHILTAQAIAKDLAIIEEGDGLKAISSTELANLTDEQLNETIEDYAVYARVSPEDKVRIVKAWQNRDKIVSMTGDGVNDSPALKMADIGCAMGITGTDVAKEAADLILTDDNFATIITAVKEGRSIYANIKNCIKYLLSSNIGEVFIIFVASILSLFFKDLGIGLPLLSIHLLWVNLVTDSLPAFGLGMERAHDEVMQEKPRGKHESFFANKLGLYIAFEGIAIGLIALSAYIIGIHLGDNKTGQTMAFLTLSTIQLFHAYNVKTDHSVFHKSTFDNKFLNYAFLIGFGLQLLVVYTPGLNSSVFKLEPLSITRLGICVGLAFSIIIIMEISKLIGYKRAHRKTRN